MTWQGKRRQELPPDWTQRRAARLELDGYRCTAPVIVTDEAVRSEGVFPPDMRVERCTNPATDVDHHVAPDRHDIKDLRSLCDPHHKAKTQAEAMAARGVGPTRLRPKRPHPGLR